MRNAAEESRAKFVGMKQEYALALPVYATMSCSQGRGSAPESRATMSYR